MTEANPLTFLVPIKQEKAIQDKAAAAVALFVPLVTAGLDSSGILHYANLSLVPNPEGKPGAYAVLLCTVFDGPMNPYLDFFWKNEGTKAAFKGIAEMALVPPKTEVKTPADFQNFINDHNISKGNGFYRGYPQSVEQIRAKFPK